MSDPPLEVFRRLTNGVYVVGVAHGDQRDAFTAAWVTQVSFDPLLLALSINPSHASFPILVAAGAFVVSVLGQGQLELALKLDVAYGEHFVDQQDVGLKVGRHREGEPHLHAARIVLDGHVDEGLDPGERDDLIEPAFDLAPSHAQDGAVDDDVFPPQRSPVKAGADLEQRADASATST